VSAQRNSTWKFTQI